MKLISYNTIKLPEISIFTLQGKKIYNKLKHKYKVIIIIINLGDLDEQRMW
jgi:hypothetical protein